MKFLVQADELTRAVKSVQCATAKDAAQPALAGIYLKAEGHTLTVVAADGFRLSVATATLPDAVDEAAHAILEKAPFLALLKVLNLNRKGGALVSVETDAGAWRFAQGSVMAVPTIDATFPDYAAIAGRHEALTPTFSVNAKLLASVLAVHGNEMVTFGFLDPEKVGGDSPIHVVRRANNIGLVEAHHVVMPMVVGV